MIYVVIGTSGSGKSTIARRILERFNKVEPLMVEGRLRPLAMRCHRPPGRATLSILGHYESPCGGSDTIHEMDTLFDLIKSEADSGSDVFLEGVLLYSVPKRFMELRQQGYPLQVVAMTEVPLDVCEESIRGRRAEKAEKAGAEPKAFGPNLRKNLTSKWKGTNTAAAKLQMADIQVFRGDRETALNFLLNQLGLK